MKVAVLLSGGVDSSVAALLLKDQGYDVMGLTMVNWDSRVGEKAAQAARRLNIEHRIVDLKELFHTRIIDYFCRSYETGNTPNPCVECNKYIKFGALLDIALEAGCDLVATGHYARIEFNGELNRYLLKKGIDSSKDQSYFLYGLKQEQLSHIIFPLGNLKKSEVRDIARQKSVPAAEAPDSQEICFITGDYGDFIKDRVKFKHGEVVDTNMKLVGTHRGLPFYTIGQRRGLGISSSRPLYVIGMDLGKNRLLVGGQEQLYTKTLYASQNNFIYINQLDSPLQVEAKIRYRANAAPAVISMETNGMVKVDFEEPQRAITRGQSVVFYRDEYVVGGGIIE
ncbi:MAG TPA: tRNA 2-thiouridine(34) synthase MnmA [Syntrophomonadaceae bacterium]|nr:tRNA 2-thiouridine(34) synthase MnmA [Syntrophomonadaceae bacterium]